MEHRGARGASGGALSSPKAYPMSVASGPANNRLKLTEVTVVVPHRGTSCHDAAGADMTSAA
jgi:hypothetical protein